MGEDQQDSGRLVRRRRQPPEERPRTVEDRQAPARQADVAAEDQQMPAWLAGLREQQQREQPQKEQPRAVEDLQVPLDQADMVEGLREQMIQAEGTLEHEEKPPLTRLFSNLKPGQRLILAVLLFLDVALCGCMALVMAGRVGLPF